VVVKGMSIDRKKESQVWRKEEEPEKEQPVR